MADCGPLPVTNQEGAGVGIGSGVLSISKLNIIKDIGRRFVVENLSAWYQAVHSLMKRGD